MVRGRDRCEVGVGPLIAKCVGTPEITGPDDCCCCGGSENISRTNTDVQLLVVLVQGNRHR